MLSFQVHARDTVGLFGQLQLGLLDHEVLSIFLQTFGLWWGANLARRPYLTFMWTWAFGYVQSNGSCHADWLKDPFVLFYYAQKTRQLSNHLPMSILGKQLLLTRWLKSYYLLMTVAAGGPESWRYSSSRRIQIQNACGGVRFFLFVLCHPTTLTVTQKKKKKIQSSSWTFMRLFICLVLKS